MLREVGIGNIQLQRMFEKTPHKGNFAEAKLRAPGFIRKAAYRRLERYHGDCKPRDCDCDCSTGTNDCGGCA